MTFLVGALFGALVCALFVYGLDIYLAAGIGGLGQELVSKFMPPLLATFAGAAAAFYFALRQQRIARQQVQISAGNFAIFRLHEMYTIATNFRQHFIKPHRSDPDRWLNMNSPPPGMVRRIGFKFEDLGFFLDHPSPKNPAAQVLSDLLFIEERFRIAIDILDLRARVIVEEVIPFLGKLVTPGATPAEAVRDFNPRAYRQLVSLTDELITRMDDIVAQLDRLYPRLRGALLFIHSKGNFVELKFEPLPT